MCPELGRDFTGAGHAKRAVPAFGAVRPPAVATELWGPRRGAGPRTCGRDVGVVPAVGVGRVVAAAWIVGGVASILKAALCTWASALPAGSTLAAYSHGPGHFPHASNLLEPNAVIPFVIIRTQLLMSDDHRRYLA